MNFSWIYNRYPKFIMPSGSQNLSLWICIYSRSVISIQNHSGNLGTILHVFIPDTQSPVLLLSHRQGSPTSPSSSFSIVPLLPQGKPLLQKTRLQKATLIYHLHPYLFSHPMCNPFSPPMEEQSFWNHPRDALERQSLQTMKSRKGCHS